MLQHGKRAGPTRYAPASPEKKNGDSATVGSGMTMVLNRNDLHAALARSASTVEAALDALLPQPEGAEAQLAEAMRYAALGGGKRLRAFLALESAALFGVSETSAARVAAADRDAARLFPGA